MNATEFIMEVKASNLCPEEFEQKYDEFRMFQNKAIRTLLEFHRICESNQIPYFLAFGSLLGVVRDGGQIPWDYDIDVIVPFEFRLKLIEALKENLNSNYYFICPEVDRRCRHTIMRLAPKEFKSEALHVDVFFLVGSPEDANERKKYQKKIASIAKLRYGKFVNLKEESVGNPKRYFRLLIKRKIPSLFFSSKYLNDEYFRLCSLYSSFTSSICIEADNFANDHEYPKGILWDTMLLKTSYGEIRIPEKYKEFLEQIYGDYLKIPKLESRISEMMYNYHRIKLMCR